MAYRRVDGYIVKVEMVPQLALAVTFLLLAAAVIFGLFFHKGHAAGYLIAIYCLVVAAFVWMAWKFFSVFLGILHATAKAMTSNPKVRK